MALINVLLVEDEDDKQSQVIEQLNSFFGSEQINITTCKNFVSATKSILTKSYDLIIADLVLPRREQETPSDVSDELLDYLSDRELSLDATVVVISQFEEMISEKRDRFTKEAIFLIHFKDEDVWKACLDVCLQKVRFKRNYDFLIFCALEAERSAFEAVPSEWMAIGELTEISGIDCLEMKIGEHVGLCILQPRMGLVDASIIAARSIELFSPTIVCMSGICGGFSSETTMGQILISDPTWEHQAGKWTKNGFEIRSYQEPIRNGIRTLINQFVQNDPTLSSLRVASDRIVLPQQGSKLAPITSGSSVIASTDYSQQIETQHGKVAGVDMEIYGIHRAAALADTYIDCFSAKTVVDLADEKKDDNIHKEGAILSARFVTQILSNYFKGILTNGSSN